MQRRVLTVTDRQVVQLYHGAASRFAQATDNHNSATAGSTASTRSQAGQASTLRALAVKKCDSGDMKIQSLQNAELASCELR